MGSTKEETSPPILQISFTKLELTKLYSVTGVRNTLSSSGIIARFIFANWNSYSKSDAALSPLKITFDLNFLQRSVVK